MFWKGKSNGECNSLEKMKTAHRKISWTRAEQNSRENLLNIRTAWSLVIVDDKKDS